MAMMRTICPSKPSLQWKVGFLLALLSHFSVCGFQFSKQHLPVLDPRRTPLRRQSNDAKAWTSTGTRSLARQSASQLNVASKDPIIPEIQFEDDEQEDASSMGAWVPVGSVSCLEGLGPTEMEIMGHKLVVWKSDQREWSVLMDECPHRQAPLSLGRVDPETKCLECPFHGWQFNSTGTLQRIPQLEEEASLQPESRSVQAFSTHLTGDLLWVFLPTPFHGESFPRSLLPEDYYHGLQDFVNKGATYYAQDLPFSYDFLIENGLDGPAHAYFAHHKLGFDRSQAGPIPCKLPVSNYTELVSEVTYRRKGTMRLRRYGFQRPFLVTNQQPAFGGGWTTAIIFFAVPIREGFCRLITTFDTLSPHPATPDWLLHIINRKFLEGDLIVHSQEHTIRNKQSANPKYIHATSSDASCRAWRSWWTKYGLSAAPKNTFGPASPENLQLLERHELVDPWTAHTHKCSKCRSALKRLKLAQKAAWAVVAWSAMAIYKRYSFLACLLGALGAASGWGAGRLIAELQGVSNKSEVGDRSLSASL